MEKPALEVKYYIPSVKFYLLINFNVFFAVESWCKSQKKRRVGIPTYEGSGSHVYQGERYRFLVIPRYGVDVGKLFTSHGRNLSTKMVNSLAVQMVLNFQYFKSHFRISFIYFIS